MGNVGQLMEIAMLVGSLNMRPVDLQGTHIIHVVHHVINLRNEVVQM